MAADRTTRCSASVHRRFSRLVSRLTSRLVVWALGWGTVLGAHAQPTTLPPPPPAASTNAGADVKTPAKPAAPGLPLWEIGFGLGAARIPHYRGSSQSRVWPLPLPYVVYRGDVFKADRDGARAELLELKNFNIDLSVAAGAPSNSKNNVARLGMTSLAPTLEFGPNLNWTVARGQGWDLDLRLPLRAGMTLERSPKFVGLVTSPNINVDYRVGDWQIGALVLANFATRQQNSYYYDVPAAFATVDRPAYRASGGYAGAQFVSGVSRRFGDVWFGAFTKVDFLGGAVYGDSPLVKRKRTVAAGFGVSWVFAKSTQTASPPKVQHGHAPP
jgi:MipA family protein